MKVLEVLDIMTTGGYIEQRQYKAKTTYILYNQKKIRRARITDEQIAYLNKRSFLKLMPAEPTVTHRRRYKTTFLTTQNIERVSKLWFRITSENGTAELQEHELIEE